MDAVPGRIAYKATELTPGTTYCQPCAKDDKKLPPEAYCPVCNEFLCANCARVHRNMKITKRHALQDKDSMPSSFSTEFEREKFTESCQLHAKEFIKYYCPNHNELLCGDCVIGNDKHRSCKVEKVTELAKGYKEGSEYNSLKTELSQIINVSNSFSTNIQVRVKSVNEESLTNINELRKFRNEINQYLEKKEKELLAEIEKKKQKSKTLLTELNTKCMNIKFIAEKLKSELQAHEANSNQLFIVGKQAMKELAGLQTAIEDVDRRKEVPHYNFHKDTTIKELFSSKIAIGRLNKGESNSALGHIKKQQKTKLSAQSSADLSLAKFSRQTDIPLRTSADTNDCYLTSVVVLPGDRMLLADASNNSVKLVNARTNNVVSEVKLPGQPWALCLLPGDREAVTLPDLGKIQFVSTKNEVSLQDIVEVGVNCYGIGFCDASLIVSFTSPCKIQLMDMKGTVKKCVDIYIGGNQFQNPRYLTVTAEGQNSTIYVSDCGSSTITNVSPALQVTKTFQDSTLSYAQGIASIGNNQFIVCGNYSDNIVLLDTSTGKIAQLLGKEDGIESPYSVAYCPQQKRLFVSCSPSNRPELENFVKVFDLV